jgi:hypothetical protein
MKKQTLLNVVLSTTVVILLFYIRTSADKPLEYPTLNLQMPGIPECNFSTVRGYSDARAVDKVSAKAAAGEFASFAARQGQSVTGGVISKAVLDSLFCTGNFNGLAYQLAMDPSGKIAPANTIFLILGGVNATEENGGFRINSQGSTFYSPNTWCPPGCLSMD